MPLPCDDTDTIGAIAGAMGGATGCPLPDAVVAEVTEASGLDLAPVVRALLTLRQGVTPCPG